MFSGHFRNKIKISPLRGFGPLAGFAMVGHGVPFDVYLVAKQPDLLQPRESVHLQNISFVDFNSADVSAFGTLDIYAAEIFKGVLQSVEVEPQVILFDPNINVYAYEIPKQGYGFGSLVQIKRVETS